MIRELLPRRAEVVETFGDAPLSSLFPEEAAVVAGAVDVRRREFATARACARAALGLLGVPPAPLLPGPHGAPRWPDGIVGSMTHCTGYRAAAVARSSDLVSIGLDAEPNEPLPSEGVLGYVALPAERERLARLGVDRPEICWDRLVFSAKESVYKAWFPLTHTFLDFLECEITVRPDTGTFGARLLVPGPVVAGTRLPGFEGTWRVTNGLVLTAVALGAP
ncbi:4'-phosphopantetheinyl transferase superfamily protein [Streptomyces sp. NBC_00435]|uniref:4'-phosphopantetheinyl transferase family protein n=1 Tax=Streptomyces sp. NBC_00435 TaxID=2903649 RepID=UPI002E21A6F0